MRLLDKRNANDPEYSVLPDVPGPVQAVTDSIEMIWAALKEAIFNPPKEEQIIVK